MNCEKAHKVIKFRNKTKIEPEVLKAVHIYSNSYRIISLHPKNQPHETGSEVTLLVMREEKAQRCY